MCFSLATSSSLVQAFKIQKVAFNQIGSFQTSTTRQGIEPSPLKRAAMKVVPLGVDPGFRKGEKVREYSGKKIQEILLMRVERVPWKGFALGAEWW